MKWASVLVVLGLAGCGAMPQEVVDQGAPVGQPATTDIPGVQEDDPHPLDLCPDDPDKLSPGVCGCNVAETDTDRDDTPDCLDGCPFDRNKIDPGDCGCRVRETDTDGDDSPDCLDHCPNDPQKIEPGLCGCGNVENGIDANADGVPDCIDQCPSDPNKDAPGICGCGIDDLDLDRDGFPDLCLDNCPFTFNPSQLDSDSDGLGDTCDPFPVGSGDVFSFLTPDETELFLILVDRLNADINSFVDSELALELFDLGSRGFSCSSAVCNAECGAEQSRISLKRDGTALSAIDAAASFGINLTLGLFERQEIDAFNCENYPNRSFSCTRTIECGLPSILCTISGPPCD